MRKQRGQEEEKKREKIKERQPGKEQRPGRVWFPLKIEGIIFRLVIVCPPRSIMYRVVGSYVYVCVCCTHVILSPLQLPLSHSLLFPHCCLLSFISVTH